MSWLWTKFFTVKANGRKVLELEAVRDRVVEGSGADDDRQVVDEGLYPVQVEALPGGDVVDAVGRPDDACRRSISHWLLTLMNCFNASVDFMIGS